MITGCLALICIWAFLPAASSKRPGHAACCRRQTAVSDLLWLLFKLELH